jgi:phosphoribosyl-ATP pyrophosphohydrolase
MINIPNIYSLRSRLMCFQKLVEAAQAKEYPADWAGSGETVLRDSQGRFAAKDEVARPIIEIKEPRQANGATTTETKPIIEINEPKQVVKPATIDLQDFLNEQATTFSESLKNFQKEQIEGVDKKVLEKATENLTKLVEKRKELAGELTDLMFGDYAKEARLKLAELCKPINLDLSNAIKEDPFESVKNDIDNIKKEASAGNVTALLKHLPQAAQYSASKYQKMTEDLQKSTGSNSQLMQALGRTASAAIPATIFFAATLGPLAVVPALATVLTHSAVTATLAGVVASAATWKIKDKALEEALDTLEVDNPLLRNVAKVSAFGATAPSSSLLNIIMPNLDIAVGGVLQLAVFSPINSTIGKIILPGQNFSQKSQKELKELRDVKKVSEDNLKRISKEAEDANQQLEKALSSIQDLASPA